VQLILTVLESDNLIFSDYKQLRKERSAVLIHFGLLTGQRNLQWRVWSQHDNRRRGTRDWNNATDQLARPRLHT
jgi:hypothetical protein